MDDIDRVEGPFTIRDPPTGAAPDARPGRRAVRAPRRPAAARARRAARARTSAAPPSGSMRSARSRRPRRRPPTMIPVIRAIDPGAGHHDRRSAAAPRSATTSSSRRPSARRTRSALTLLASGVDPVPAVRLGRHPDQGHDHDPALDHRELRGAGLDLPGGQPLRTARLRAARLHHRRQPDHHVRVIFGLSMDYEVLLLSRIQEAYRRTGDNTASVAEGLSKTAGVITGAALIMVVGLRGLRARRGHHDQEHRRRDGDRGRRSTRRSSGSCWCRPRCG